MYSVVIRKWNTLSPKQGEELGPLISCAGLGQYVILATAPKSMLTIALSQLTRENSSLQMTYRMMRPNGILLVRERWYNNSTR